MALCLANSLVARRGFVPYDQLVRYKWWYENGYMSSTGQCFDIGAATSQSLKEFIRRQHTFAKEHVIPRKKIDNLSDQKLLQEFPVYCSMDGVAGNGALMRLAPVPLFFYRFQEAAVEFSGVSGKITHGDEKAYDACRYYGALIVAALNNSTKDELLDKDFYEKHKSWFNNKPLCNEIKMIMEGSYQKEGGYKDGIRGKGYIINALEAALWAFWSDENSFETGVLAAINLGDDADTTAAIYGQLAGAYYGYRNLPTKWVDQVYARTFILNLSKWIAYEGENWKQTEAILPSHQAPVRLIRSISAENILRPPPIKGCPSPESNSRLKIFSRAGILRFLSRNKSPARYQNGSPKSTPTCQRRMYNAKTTEQEANAASHADT
jgi:ADP-ribosylglycohydrolase